MWWEREQPWCLSERGTAGRTAVSAHHFRVLETPAQTCTVRREKAGVHAHTSGPRPSWSRTCGAWSRLGRRSASRAKGGGGGGGGEKHWVHPHARCIQARDLVAGLDYALRSLLPSTPHTPCPRHRRRIVSTVPGPFLLALHLRTAHVLHLPGSHRPSRGSPMPPPSPPRVQAPISSLGAV
ncbi:hypothetical protein C8R45DRAFT_574706 [Mycena sanguinolenta]|nr:hypothetical protein C8R45DRAFT_574706 [Mycena sanguinolenta]